MHYNVWYDKYLCSTNFRNQCLTHTLIPHARARGKAISCGIVVVVVDVVNTKSGDLGI